ncbi:Peptidase propeptide and YPEB domain-containing protein [Thermoanaerobacter uzonensis DSM 18761]|uniref:Peptidase propeptide and YPEB domain-containing protein n=1 Tax=Thermoanaerobacter uzonensis DSM 18761 TaxID=1123369 RepID=A0A1M4Z285_9THEO|nr:S-layer homology domain-containing protein [Thermoanaerobacter uzonensis]SHF11706.1 Peptidase propeptide and YPEB domain-containing protein [Thermoanaerobacter uzonensis DSM 18761]
MKKFISIAIALVFLFTLIVTPNTVQAQADTKISLKQAIEIAKTKLDISDNGYDFSSNYYEYGNTKSWILNWNSSSKGNISVTIDADTGEITNYYGWSPVLQKQTRIPKYTQDEAKKVAIEFLQKIAPEKFKETKEQIINSYGYNDYSYDYNFSFERIVNDIPFPYNSLNVTVNKNTLKVTSYSLTWGNYTFPDPKAAISKEEAIKIFKEKIGLKLQYNLVYDQVYGDEPQAILVYGIYQNAPIDAITGEIKTSDNYYMPMYGGRGGDVGAESSQKFSPEEQKAIEASEKYISKDKAIEVVKNNIPFSISDYKLSSVNLYSNNNYPPAKSNPIWSLNWSLTKDNKYYYVNASVDAVTGELISFSIGNPDMDNVQGKKPSYTKEQMRKIAEDYLKKIIPEKFSKTAYQEENYKMIDWPSYPFRYVEISNGILCPFNNINVNVNQYTGDIVSYSINWTSVKLPAAENTISLEEAYKIMFDNSEFTLMYIPDSDYKSPDQPPTIQLVYQSNFFNYINAKTGQIIDYSGKPVVKQSKINFTDIKGNWAEKDINLLVQYGIIDVKEDKFYPNKDILQKDFIKILIKAIQPDYYYTMPSYSDDYDTYYAIAINKNIITEKEKSPDSIVTRQQAAKMLVKSLGAGYIADIPDIFIINFKDNDKIPKDMIGYIAIVSGLKIMNGSDGYFEPQQPLTRAQAAAVIVRYLQLNK